MKTAVVRAINSPNCGIPLSQAVGERQWRTTLSRGANDMAKARVAPTTELLEDVVRGPRPASSEALPWWHLFTLSHFLEGVQGRCLRWDPRQAEPPARCCRASGVAIPLYREKEVKTSPPLRGGKIAREGFSPTRERVAYQRRLETCPPGQGLRARGERILSGSSCDICHACRLAIVVSP
jgi:hypothetical protein